VPFASRFGKCWSNMYWSKRAFLKNWHGWARRLRKWGLTPKSPLSDFQRYSYENLKIGCPKPCKQMTRPHGRSTLAPRLFGCANAKRSAPYGHCWHTIQWMKQWKKSAEFGLGKRSPNCEVQRHIHNTEPSKCPQPCADIRKAPNAIKWTAEYPRKNNQMGPINDATSFCKNWWNKRSGPGWIGAKASAERYKRHGKLNVMTVTKTSSKLGHVIGLKSGCTSPMRNTQSSHKSSVIVCGCYEIWCPYKNNRMSEQGECFTLRVIMGCFKSKGWSYKGRKSAWIWHPECRENNGWSQRCWLCAGNSVLEHDQCAFVHCKWQLEHRFQACLFGSRHQLTQSSHSACGWCRYPLSQPPWLC